MAAIEKICEYSGDYCGWDMYEYKRNSIQVAPRYRELFRGATAKLIIREKTLRIGNKRRDALFYPDDWFPGHTLGSIDYSKYSYGHGGLWRTRVRYEYSLVVEDKHLQGIVGGEYIHYSSEISDVKRKLIRLLRCDKNKFVVEDKTGGYIFCGGGKFKLRSHKK